MLRNADLEPRVWGVWLVVMRQRQMGDHSEGCGGWESCWLGLVVGLPLATAVTGPASLRLTCPGGRETARVPAAQQGADTESQGWESPQKSPATSSHYPEHVWKLREGRKSPSSSVRTWQSCALRPGQSSLLLHFNISAGFFISFSPLFSGIWPFLFGIYCSGSVSADGLVSVIDFASKSHWPWALPQAFWPVALCAPLGICLDSWLAVLLVWLLLPGDPSEAMPS